MYQNVVIYILCRYDFVLELDQQQMAHYTDILTNYHKLEPDQLKTPSAITLC
jgi:hypothetical protein